MHITERLVQAFPLVRTALAARARWLWPLCLLAIGIALLYYLPFHLLPLAMDDELEYLRRTQTPSVRFYDADGKLVKYQRNNDLKWRVPVKLSQVSPHFLDALLAIEDRDFYKHGALSYPSIARAALTNFRYGRIISGASTITMQLAYLSRSGGKRKGYLQKLEQTFKAILLEKRYSKETILEEYVNRVYFGYSIYGIEAASLYYFDKHASELTLEEAAVLAGIPQLPNIQNPKACLQKCKRRQRMVLQAMEKYGFLAQGEANSYYDKPLYLRDYSQKSLFAKHSTMKYDMFFFNRGTGKISPELEHHTYLNSHYHQLMADILEDALKQVNKPELDAAAVLIDSHANRLIALIGTQNYQNALDGWVNGATSIRNVGSTLKPFIYAKAIEAGLITSQTILKDAPVRYGNYTPGNFNGTYCGNVTVEKALSQSLNTPVVRLLSQLGVSNTFSYLQRFEVTEGLRLFNADEAEKRLGLTIALGTSGSTLFNLARAYNALANGGNYCHSILNMPNPAADLSTTRLCSEGTACLINNILRQKQLPNCVLDIAWKTGTSSGYRDAWCIAYTPDFTLGVWFGDKFTSRGSHHLVGADLAAPTAGRIFSAIYATHELPTWPSEDKFLDNVLLCNHSGLRPGPYCKEQTVGLALKEIALATCASCGKKKPSIHILSPRPTTYLARDSKGVELFVNADAQDAIWFVDNRYVGAIDSSRRLCFTPGTHKLIALSSNDTVQRAAVVFRVKNPL